MTRDDGPPPEEEPTADRTGPADRAERLAAWLEHLGLLPHLEGAGLPTVARDADGRARWTDPGTGAPLTEEQLAELEALLRSEGSDPAHAVPVALVQVARLARVREALLATPCLTYETLAERRGTSVDAARFAVHRAANDGLLLVVADGGRTLVPAFQLTDAGELRPELEPVLRTLLGAGADPWRVWGWLTQPAGLLGGEVPERAAADPASAGLVLHAAARLAERVTARRPSHPR